MADGAFMAARARPIKHDAQQATHKSSPADAVPLKWFGSQITEDNLNVDYVSNSLREEDRKPEVRAAAAAAVEALELARLVPLDH